MVLILLKVQNMGAIPSAVKRNLTLKQNFVVEFSCWIQPCLVGLETQGKMVPKGSCSKPPISASTFSYFKLGFETNLNYFSLTCSNLFS